MKPQIKNFIKHGLVASAVLFGIVTSNAQTQLLLDPTQNWIGFVNVFNLPSNGGGYQFGSSWAPAALTVYYDQPTQPYNNLTIIANTNTYAPGNPYWTNPDGSGNETVDASYYVQNDSLEGQNLVFSGNCINNTFAAPYTSTVFIKEFDVNYNVINSAVTTAVSGQPFSISLQTGSGSHIQYGFETIGPDANPATVYNLGDAVYQVQYPPIELSTLNSQAAVVGQNATFSETPTGNPPFQYQWALNGTPLVNSSHISGATGSALTILDTTAADAGIYSVFVTNNIGSNAVATAQLVSIPLAQAQTNYVIDPSFENDAFAPASTIGWFSYGGTGFGNTNDFYSAFDPSINPDVTVIDGTNSLIEYSQGAGSYTGVFQDRPALPGQIYTASAWFFTPTATDGYNLVGNASANLQVQFNDINGNLIVDYESAPFTTNYAQGVWMQMPVTNEYANDFVTLLNHGSLIVSPPGTASMRIQPGYHAPTGTDAGDIYIDMVDVTLQETTPTPSVNGTSLNLTFPTIYGPQYNVLYRTSLTTGAWQVLTSVAGDGTVKTVSDTIGTTPRFYVIDTAP